MPALLSIPPDPLICPNGVVLTAAAQMNADLASVGLDFEGKKTVPYSTIATGIPEVALKEVVSGAGEIHRALESLLHGFVAEHRRGFLDGPLHRLYTPYYPWWDHIASEQRTLRPINLLRFDTIVDDDDADGRWSLLENNTCCPGGVTQFAHIRQAWMRTEMAVAELAGQQVVEHTINDPDGFVHVLDQLLSETGNGSCIALLNYKGVFTYELSDLKGRFDSLKKRGLVKSSDLILGDLRDLDCNGERAYIGGIEVGLIYCKVSPSSLEPDDPDIRGWLNTLRSPHVEQVNSLGAIFLTEAKRSIAGLLDDKIRAAINLSAQQMAAIDHFYPRTWLAADRVALDDDVGDPRNDNDVVAGMQRFVLKADSSTRGLCVFVATPGVTTQAEWEERIQQVIRDHGVVQEKRRIPRWKVPVVVPASCGVGTNDDDDNGLNVVMEYHGVDLFFFRGEFGGAMGRSHAEQVINVGSGGRFVPVVVLKEKGMSRD